MPWLAILQGGWGFVSSRFGNVCIAFMVAWLWSAHKTNQKWETYVAAEKAAAEIAYQKEITRQVKVTQEIAAAATQRAEDDAALARDLQEEIDDLKDAEKSNAPTHTLTPKQTAIPCTVDADLARRMQHLDTRARQTRAPRAARKVR